MCGITGYVTRESRQDSLCEGLGAAVRCLEHRGPDDHGTWHADGVGLGHRRLSILDLSQHGHQPMFSRDGRFAIVFNGEIYNFASIRKRLESLGHAFSGSGDTEVILAAFHEWGVQRALDHCIGMFAFALWDVREKSLTLVRDRVGVKPLYYGWDGRTLWFGSELKALRAFPHWQPTIDRVSVGEYLQYGYIAGPRSIYERVRKLEPGCLLTLGPDGEPVIERYWNALDARREPLRANDDAIEAELESLLEDAFRHRMVSDVPVGVYLSGGVDSSLVTALLSRNASEPLRTFTIGFREQSRDESPWARRVAAHLGTRHTEYILDVREALDIARGWGDLFDEPFGDASGIPTLMVSRLARAEVKVVLSADGGDELFGGYSVYDDVLQRLESLGRIPAWARSASASALQYAGVDSIDRALSRVGTSAARRGFIERRIRRSRAILPDASPSRVYDAAISYWLPEEVEAVLGAYTNPRRLMDAYPGDVVEQMCLWDFHHYLPEDVLTKVDRTTMAVSLEGREPMLDHRVIEYAMRLPPHLRRGTLGPKHILKKILYRHVPRELVDRPKQGFAVPLERWLRDDLRSLVHEFLAESRVRRAGIFDAAIVRRLVDDFYRGDATTATHVWFLLAFEMWRERWTPGTGEPR